MAYGGGSRTGTETAGHQCGPSHGMRNSLIGLYGSSINWAMHTASLSATKRQKFYKFTKAAPENGTIHRFTKVVPEIGTIYKFAKAVPENGTIYQFTKAVPENRTYPTYT